MDAQTSNNVSRALHDLSGTVGQYAQMAHEERMEQAREQFAQMLEATKEKQAQTQHQIDQQQAHSQFEETRGDNATKMAQEAKHQDTSDANEQAYRSADLGIKGAELGNEVNRTRIDQENADTNKAKSLADKTSESNSKILEVYNTRQKNADAVLDRVTQNAQKDLEDARKNDLGYMAKSPAEKAAIDNAVMQKHAPNINAAQARADKAASDYNTLQSKIAGVPADDSTSPSSATAPQGVSGNKPAGYYKGAGANYGKPVYKDPSGKMTFDSGTAGSTPGAPGSNPQSSVQTDQGTLDTSPAPADAGPAPANTGAPAAPSQLAQQPAATPPAPQTPPPVSVAQSAPAGSPQAGMPGLLPGQPPQPGTPDPNDPSQQPTDPSQTS